MQGTSWQEQLHAPQWAQILVQQHDCQRMQQREGQNRRPPLPAAALRHGAAALGNRQPPHSTLTHSLQAVTVGQDAAVAPAVPVFTQPSFSAAAAATNAAPVLALPAIFPPANASSLDEAGWKLHQQQQFHVYRWAADSQQAAVAGAQQQPWPGLPAQSYQHSFQAPQHMAAHLVPQLQQLATMATVPQDACARQDIRRVRRRRPTPRRNLLDHFDAALAGVVEQENNLSYQSDSDGEMMVSSQGTSSLVARPAPFSTSPGTPFNQEIPAVAPSPASVATPASYASTPPSAAALSLPSPSSPEGHLLPLQHLLMSERAQHLTALEVKIVIAKMAYELAAMHDAGLLHRHVTIASVALSRSGEMATARLLSHPFNVHAGQGRRYTGGRKAGLEPYVAPELARCPTDRVTYTPAGDMWSLGVVLFVLLSGSHVPFGNRGLCWTTVPNMPGPHESVDKLQRWLEEHLTFKVHMVNQMKESQEKGKGAVNAVPDMRVIGIDGAACDLLFRLLTADPAARPSASQVLSHPFVAALRGLVVPPAQGNVSLCSEAPSALDHELARLGFSAVDDVLQRHLRTPFMASGDFHSDSCRSSASPAHLAQSVSVGLPRVDAPGFAGVSSMDLLPTSSQALAEPQQTGHQQECLTASCAMEAGLQLMPARICPAMMAGNLICNDPGCFKASTQRPAYLDFVNSQTLQYHLVHEALAHQSQLHAASVFGVKE